MPWELFNRRHIFQAASDTGTQHFGSPKGLFGPLFPRMLTAPQPSCESAGTAVGPGAFAVSPGPGQLSTSTSPAAAGLRLSERPLAPCLPTPSGRRDGARLEGAGRRREPRRRYRSPPALEQVCERSRVPALLPPLRSLWVNSLRATSPRVLSCVCLHPFWSHRLLCRL